MSPVPARILLRSAVAASLLLLLLVCPAPAEEGRERIVAIGDIHGSYDGLLSILQAAGLADEEGAWTGGRATLVQLGDFTDRGGQVRQVMDTLMRLQVEAAAAGGEAIVLLGNHDVMNLMGDLRDVTPEIYATFAGDRDEELREQAWQQWVDLARQQARWRWATFRRPGAEDRERFDAARPPGYFEYIEALGPEGEYGRWLRSLPVVARVGDVLFVHGGISPEVATMSVEEVNQAVAQELRDFDRLLEGLVEHGIVVPYSSFTDVRDGIALAMEVLERSPRRLRGEGQAAFVEEAFREFVGLGESLSFGSDGPLWFRGYGRWDEDEGREEIEPIVEAYGVERIVVGHTPPSPPSDIQMRFGGRVFLIDTGMLPGHYPDGRPSALELAGDRVTALYEGQREVMLPGGPEGSVAAIGSGRGGDPEVRADLGSSAPVVEGVDPPVSLSAGQEAEAEAPDGLLDVAGGPWIGPAGEPLPFASDEEVLDFLRRAEVLEIKNIPVGVTRPRKLLLEMGGVRAHAIFRYQHVVRDRSRFSDGTVLVYFRDSYSGEPAAYELARLLGLETVPPAAPRRMAQLGEGSIQLWIEDAMTELDRRERGVPPPDPLRHIRHLYNMVVFDNLVNNTDRNLGNILVGPDWKVWYIDCTRCFSRNPYLPHPEDVRKVERQLWERLQGLDLKAVRQRLAPYLGPGEMPALVRRHARLVRLIEERIEELGEEEVLFDFPEDSPLDGLELPEIPTGNGESLFAAPEED